MEDLKKQKCVPCEAGGSPLSAMEVDNYAAQISEAWEVAEKKISRRFVWKDFAEAMDFVNRVAKLAEAEGHHPDLRISYNLVDVELWTHAVDGLSPNDFILAAKIEDLINHQPDKK